MSSTVGGPFANFYDRAQIWLDPFAEPYDRGYQLVQQALSDLMVQQINLALSSEDLHKRSRNLDIYIGMKKALELPQDLLLTDPTIPKEPR